MKNIVIAAGYATRLGELTKNFPKPLLKIGDNTILGRMLDDIDQIPEIDEHIIITNHKFAPIFEEWKSGLNYQKPITIIDDGTDTNETRLGAVCDLLQPTTSCFSLSRSLWILPSRSRPVASCAMSSLRLRNSSAQVLWNSMIRIRS